MHYNGSFPCLDVQQAFYDAQDALLDLRYLAESIYLDSDETWTEMHQMAEGARLAFEQLGGLRQGIRNAAEDERLDLDKQEDRADATS